MELTTEQVDGLVAAGVEAALNKVNRKFTPSVGVDEQAPREINSTGAKFKSFGEFLRTIRYNTQDARLKTGFSEGSDVAGGFTVPEEFLNKLLMDSLEQSVIRGNGATVVPMGRDTMNIPKIVDSSHASTVFGGVVGYWLEEGGTKTPTQPTFGQIKLIAKKLIGYTYASDELLDDNAVGLSGLISTLFGNALAWYEDDAFINGSGVGQPLGILKSGSLLSLNRTAVTTVGIADLANMVGRLLPGSFGRAVWLANPVVLPKLVQLASTTLVWQPFDQGMAKAPPATVLGRPIYFTEKCAALGSAGDLILADLSYYLIGDRQKMTMATSKDVMFTTDQTAWRFVERVDGQPWVDAKFQPKNGSTLSPFVTLYSLTTGGD
jgi:HK97 family phage major capsid protein